jgi:hypothetical protein
MAKEIVNRIKRLPRKRLIILLVAIIIALIAATSTYIFFLAPSTTTPVSSSTTTSITSFTTASTSIISSTAASVNTVQDYNLFVEPYLAQLTTIEAVLTQPYDAGSRQSYGYDPTFGVTCGGNIEPAPAINVSNGYNNVCVLIDNNLEGGASLDYFASSSSVLVGQLNFSSMNLQVYTKTRQYLSMPFYGIGSCSPLFTVYNYPSNFSLLDRREAEYGFAGPYATQLLQPGIQIGGIGSLTCNGATESGQIWFLENYDNPATTMIVTEFPNGTPPTTNSNLEELSFVIDELYMQCVAGKVSCSQWQNAYQNAMSQYPFKAPREALHFIQVTRATGAWAMSNMSYNGTSAETMLQNTLAKIFTPESSGGALGPDGGLSQSWGRGGDKTPEPNFQAMVAFDPRIPSWFTLSCLHNSNSCTLT